MLPSKWFCLLCLIGNFTATRPMRATEEEQIEALVKSLRAEAPTPTWSNLSDERVPPSGIDDPKVTAELNRIEKVIPQIFAKGQAAFPVLIRHFGDKDYSCTIKYSDFSNLSVGQVCTAIIRYQIEVYDPYARYAITPPYHGKPRFTPELGEDLAKWLKQNVRKSLLDLQREAVEFAIQEEQRRGNLEDEEEKKKTLADLTSLQAKLTASKEPIDSKFRLPIYHPKIRNR